MSYLTVVPAYGRDYKSAKELRADLIGGKDFRIESFGRSGQYFSVRDLSSMQREGITTLNIRYNRLTKVFPVDVDKLLKELSE